MRLCFCGKRVVDDFQNIEGVILMPTLKKFLIGFSVLFFTVIVGSLNAFSETLIFEYVVTVEALIIVWAKQP